MKISYKVLKSYKENIKNENEVAKDLVMHTAEVEDIVSEKSSFENIVYWIIKTVENHPDADSLRVCMVDVWDEEVQIVCWGSNLEVWQAVAVAKLWAVVSWHWTETITMKKTAIRWVESYGMICASEEIGLKEEFPAKDEKEIMDLSSIKAEPGTNLADLLWKNDSILEIDNKAINHRPDLFSHIGIIREIYTIDWEKFDFEYELKDFSNIEKLNIENTITDVVTRYIWVKVENVSNIDSPQYIKDVLSSAEIASKWILVDLSNYSLYLYGQPTHCFDADKIEWNITIRYAKQGEKFIALNDNEYELSEKDIVIADDVKVLAIWGVIGWKSSSVDNNTKNIIIESANFEQSIIRQTWKRLWIRTDSLNVFEKDIVNELQIYGASLIVSELEKNLEWIKITWFSDSYVKKQEVVEIEYDIDFFNNLIGKTYTENEILNILENLWIKKIDNKLIIPFWRKDLNFKADIAEEIARITWYNSIEATIPEINMWAVIQNNSYKLKNDSRNFFTDIWFYDIYNYSFVNKDLMEKCLDSTDSLVEMKNALSEELSHLRWSLIPNLLDTIEKNQLNFDELKVFEIEKVFNREWNEVKEEMMLSWLISSKDNIIYYEIQEIISKFLKTVWIYNFEFRNSKNLPKYSHKWRTASVIIRGKEVWFVWEISPKVIKNFEINSRLWFFEINSDLILDALYWIKKYEEISNFQENNFDLNFVISKDVEASKIKAVIEKADKKLIKKVNLIDIYENSEKLWEKRSLTFKIFIQSMEKTLDDKDKASIIEKIVNSVAKLGWELR